MNGQGATREDYLAAKSLCAQVGPLMGVSAWDALDALVYVPEEQLVLLRSPGGWSALAGTIADDLGANRPRFMPTVH